MHTNFVGNIKRKDHLADLGVDGRIIFTKIVKTDVRECGLDS
jgi:hypothetical protein